MKRAITVRRAAPELALLVCAGLARSCVAFNDSNRAVAPLTSEDASATASPEDPSELADENGAGIPCGLVRAAVDRRRTDDDRRAVQQALQFLRAEVPHRHIPLTQLIEFARPAAGHGYPVDPVQQQNVDTLTGAYLCDDLAREWIIRAYLPTHPEYLTSGGH